MEKSSSLLVHFDKGTPAIASEIREALEGSDVEAKIDAMKKEIMLMLNGQSPVLPHPIDNDSYDRIVLCIRLLCNTSDEWKASCSPPLEYTRKQIDEVRIEWAKYVMKYHAK